MSRTRIAPLLTAALSILSICSIAQDFSNKGKEFWIPYSYHVGMKAGLTGQVTMTLYITSDVNTNYTVETFGTGVIKTGTITAGQVDTCLIPKTNFINAAGLFTGKSVRVTAERPVVVYSYITQSAVSGATVCLPTNVLGKEYYSMNYTQVANENRSNSYFTIIAVEDNTTVEIVPSATTTNGWQPGSTNTVTLNKGEIYQVLGTENTTPVGNMYSGEDLTGSRIRSIASSGSGGCKRIAVFSGAGKIRIGANCANSNSSDNLYQQLYPVSTWGKEFLTVPSYSRPTNIYRIMKSKATANVYLNGTLIPPASFVNNLYYEFTNSTPNSIRSDEPIAVSQYFTTQGCSGNPSPYDPDMILLNPLEQNISKVTLVSSNLVAGSQQHHIHLIMPNTGTGISSFKYDGNPVAASAWVPHPERPGYSYLYLANVVKGYHTLTSDSGFVALAYGYASAESYGYSAGANVKDLYQFISIQNNNAKVNVPSTCNNTPFRFSMTFPYKPTKLQWIFGSGLNAQGVADVTQTNPTPTKDTVVNNRTLYVYTLPNSYTLTNTGTYPVKLLANNPTPDGCEGEQEIGFDLEVFPTPTSDFTFVGGCKDQPVKFTETYNLGGRSVGSVLWEFGDNTTGNTQNPEHTYGESKDHTVKYTLISDLGCVANTVTKTVPVTPLPTATITGTINTCQNAPNPEIIFTGQGATPPYTFTYTINGGAPQTAITTGTATSVSVFAPTTAMGTFTYSLVSIKESSPGACVNNQSGTAVVRVKEPPVPSITGTVDVCKDGTAPKITFAAADGMPPYTFTYNINGGATQTVSTTATSSSVTVDAPTGTPGTYTYTLTGFIDAIGAPCELKNLSLTAVVKVNPLPTATIAGSTNICLNAPMPKVSFTGANGTAPYTFRYTINGGAVQSVTTTSGNSATVDVPTSTAGTYAYDLVSVTDASSTTCTQAQSGTATFVVWPLPTADYSTNTPVCTFGKIDFTDKSLANVGTLTTWQWDFADPTSGAANTSTAQNPTHHFNAPGSYPVRLTVTTSNGCVSVNTLPALVVHPKPEVDMVLPEVCLDDTYGQFRDSSRVAAPGTITAWAWNFGDPKWNDPPFSSPNTATTQNPQHRYKAVGNYPIELIVTTNHGCKDTGSKTLTVNGSYPTAKFNVRNPTTLCANDSVAIIDESTVFPGVITRVEIWWDNLNSPNTKEVDDYPAFGKRYTHLYPNFQQPLKKTYQIKYRAFSGGVCINDRIETITVNAAPKVRFNTMPNICYDAAPYQITQAAEIGLVPGSGAFTGPGVSPTGLFDPAAAGVGVHTIKYRFTSTTGGCADSITQTIKVWERAVPDFTVSTAPVCEKQAATFTDKSTSAEGTITEWRWDFGDGTAPVTRNTGAAFTHVYAHYGTYTAKLTVVTSNGCVSAVKSLPVAVQPLARPNFTFPPISCLPNVSIPFTNLSTVPGGTPESMSYLWDFGDPGSGAVNSSTLATPEHTYAQLGPYNVKLQATTAAGCIHDTTIVLNTIHPEPQGAFTTDVVDMCFGGAIQFTNTSDPADGTTTQYFWDMGDGSNRSVAGFSHTYAQVGLYEVSLYIVNSLGCKSSVFKKTVSINPIPVVKAGPNRVMLDGGSLVIQAEATGNGLTYLWTPATGLNDPTLLKPTASPAVDTRFLLRATSDKGCSDTSSMFLKVLYKPEIPNTFSPNGDIVNDRWEILYLDSYPGAVVEIFNDRGQLLYRSVNYPTPWDGTVNGRPLPIGTYYYVIDPKNGRKKMSGYVTILR